MNARLWHYAYTNLDLAADGSPVTCPIYLLHHVDHENKVVPGSELVSFHARQGPTDWHGSWQIEKGTREGQTLTISFNARGGNQPLRSTIMWPAALETPGGCAGDWIGMDYRGRRIEMIFRRYLTQNGIGWNDTYSV
jgi:hypothetical protein